MRQTRPVVKVNAALHRRATVLALVPVLLVGARHCRSGPAVGQPWSNCRGLVVQSEQQLRCEPTDSTISGARRRAPPRAALWMGRRFDLNEVSADDLTLVPGIGRALACRLVQHRRVNGPFASVERAQRVKGIGPKLLKRLSAYATVYRGRRSVSPSSSECPSPSP